MRHYRNHKKILLLLCLMQGVFSFAQRRDILLDRDWQVTANLNQKNVSDQDILFRNFPGYWKPVSLPHNLDDYHGYRRLLHGNLHGDAWYGHSLFLNESNKGKRYFLYFEGVGSYAKVYVNRKLAGTHAGGRTGFTIDITPYIQTTGAINEISVNTSHPSNIQDLPWVCGGCSDERGFSEGSQPFGIFRPVHLVVTNDIRIEPFGVHAWADINQKNAKLYSNSTIKNYSAQPRKIQLEQQLLNRSGVVVNRQSVNKTLQPSDSLNIPIPNIPISNIQLWSNENPYLYKIVTLIKENGKILDRLETDFGFRTISWNGPSKQFILNGKPVFLNGIAEYEHLLGQSHAFSEEQIRSRLKWIQSAGFNSFRDGHQPHHLLYGKLFNQKGILWWTQLSAHVWYDTKAFRDNFKQLLKEWVIERRNDPAVMLWGLQNESKLPKDFAEECTALIRSLDPTASTQRLVTTCNGGVGTDWDVPQNWTGTYGGNPDEYAKDLKKQVLVGEYGAWRSIDWHTEGGFDPNGPASEDRFTALMEKKIRLAESVKDSVAGHFMWLLTSHDNPGRVQGGEGLRDIDRIGPVNYKGLLTPWEEPTDAFYMYRSNYANKLKEPMVYIVSHTWPNRWTSPGIKNGLIVYSNCDEVELFNDMEAASLGKRKRNGIGTHFQWDSVYIRYNILYAVGYVNGKAVARDTITLMHLPIAPGYRKLTAKAGIQYAAEGGYEYVYRVNCGGPDYEDGFGRIWQSDRNYIRSWGNDFEGISSAFASQRRIFSPLRNTTDSKLFQTFRYGKDRMRFRFNVDPGEYRVELYFMEPWLGVGGGMNATGMRLFDVAINDKTVINDLDIWKEAGTQALLKKVITVTVNSSELAISFPETKAGQAVIAAIAIAKKETEERGYLNQEGGKAPIYRLASWLDIGDKIYFEGNAEFHQLPSALYGADWIRFIRNDPAETADYTVTKEADFYIGVRLPMTLPAEWKDFESLNSQIETWEDSLVPYRLYRKRIKAGTTLKGLRSGFMYILREADNMQPAYDLKPVTQYRAAAVPLNETIQKDSVNGRYCVVINTNQAEAGFQVQTGVGDHYSFTVKYYWNKETTISGRLQLLDAGGRMMMDEPVSFSFTRPGKWNQFTLNTATMINAGNYTVRLLVKDGKGLALSSVDVQ
jgi:beta-galactosidase